MSQQQLRSGVLQMLAAMALSGTIGWFVLQSGQPVWNVVFVRCLLGSLGLGLYAWWRGQWRSWPFTARSLAWCVAGGLALVANWLLLFNAYHYSSIGIATVVYHTQPFWLLLLGRLLLGESLSPRKLGAVGVAFAGMLLIVQPGQGGHATLFGIVLALGAAILYAVVTLISKQLPKTLMPTHIACVQTLTGVLLLWPMLNTASLAQAGGQWGYLLALGLVHTTLMYIIMYAAFRQLPTHWIGLLGFAYPVVALLVDYLAYGNLLDGWQLLGVLLIVAANVWGLQRVPAAKVLAATARQ
ncbi:DMT family transporter [Vogesella sp. LIG4]|uniref:DMT family transporter n=1 Tax=Vogesella sp. LIG4 TaxID=1192162 RepID=UPI00081FCD04|nr:EamA family transporter [Vogesella sp. LIG4]SCK18934.1 Threonine/homoserine efflux transporter RhtA [Vogesella sp. LIG4]